MPTPPPKPLPSSPAAPLPSALPSPPASPLPKPARNTPHPAHAASSPHRATHRRSSSALPHARVPARYKTPAPASPLHPHIPAAAEPAHTHTSDRESTQSILTTSDRRSDTQPSIPSPKMSSKIPTSKSSAPASPAASRD